MSVKRRSKQERKRIEAVIQTRVDREVGAFLRAWMEWYKAEFGVNRYIEVFKAMNRRESSPDVRQDAQSSQDETAEGETSRIKAIDGRQRV